MANDVDSFAAHFDEAEGRLVVDKRSKPYQLLWQNKSQGGKPKLLGVVVSGVIRKGESSVRNLLTDGREFKIIPTAYSGTLEENQQVVAIVETGKNTVSKIVAVPE